MRPESLFPFFASIETINGIGKKTASLCKNLCGENVIDLLTHMPSGLIDRRHQTTLANVSQEGIVTLKVWVDEHIPPKTKKSPHKVICHDETDHLTIVFFHAFGNYPNQALPVGLERLISGKIEKAKDFSFQMTHPEYIVTLENADKIPSIECVYPLTAGVSGKILNKAIRNALDKTPDLTEWIDPETLSEKGWVSFKKSLKLVHAPENDQDLSLLDQAKARLAYDELLANQLALGLVRQNLRCIKGRQIKGNGIIRKSVLEALPFDLTTAQKRVIQEINADMDCPIRMLRLVQGDVGSGKTVVALIAMLNAVEAGFQAVLMAPTDILANQHFETISKMLAQTTVKTALLTGKDKGKKRQEIMDQIKSGQAHIIIGTHALFQEDVCFADLALTIVDEQHKFGVHQRLALSDKGENADMLVMTATPIPRTLALTHYGDMESSVIDELPKGRQAITTRVLSITRLEEVILALNRTLQEGNQVYWVCPLVEESETLDLTAAQERYEVLLKNFGTRVGLVHGRMKAAEKEEVMRRFKSYEIDILVATTVIEVGVDVKNATVMVIEHAERFGLAQLHQLRGRIGRGEKASTCLLLYADPLTQTAKARLGVMRDSQDGFKIAEQDLTLRGAGEVLGTKQSGVQEFKIADLTKHDILLTKARSNVRNILATDPHLTLDQGKALRNLLYLWRKEEAIKTLLSG